MKKLFSALLGAYGFLTRLPVPYVELELKDFSLITNFFPVVGATEGFTIGLAIAILLPLLKNPQLLAILGIVTSFLVRGIFHLDGLSDTCDALCIKPSGNEENDIEKRLTIMKDSTVGVGGVAGVVTLVLTKFVVLTGLIRLKLFFPALIVAYALSRWIIVLFMCFTPPAKASGLGYLLGKNMKKTYAVFASLITLLICFGCLFFYYGGVRGLELLGKVGVLLLLWSLIFRQICMKNFRGLTGDTLGALVETSEVLSLVAFLLLGGKI